MLPILDKSKLKNFTCSGIAYPILFETIFSLFPNIKIQRINLLSEKVKFGTAVFAGVVLSLFVPIKVRVKEYLRAEVF